MNAKVYWLASYPKSGNTWIRIFLANLLEEKQQPVDINRLNKHPAFLPIATDRKQFDRTVGVLSEDLSQETVLRLRPWVLRRCLQRSSAQQSPVLFSKAHDANITASAEERLYPPDLTSGVLYIVRSPFDVAISYSHHYNISIDQAIHEMADIHYGWNRSEDKYYLQLAGYHSSWSKHILSWLDHADYRVHLVRFEEMKYRPRETFQSIVRFFGLPHNDTAIQQAIQFSQFKELKKQEERVGFSERVAKKARFFRKGEAGAWREILTSDQIQQIIQDHGPVMQRLGYLDQHNNPIDETIWSQSP
ncbi:sulfotransferase domain-containing protein [Magnetococcales bacterium HHB-1]